MGLFLTSNSDSLLAHLSDPFAGTRYFQTNSTHEHEFLEFLDEVSGLSLNLRTYDELVSVYLYYIYT